MATSIGAEGLDFRDGHELLLRDDAKSFADACIELLGNDSLCERLASAAQEAALRHYGRDKIATVIRNYVIEVCNNGPVSVSAHLKLPDSA